MRRGLENVLADEGTVPKKVKDILRQYSAVLTTATDSRAPVLRNAAMLPRPKAEILTALKTAFRYVRRDENRQAIERAILELAGFVNLKELPADQQDQCLALTRNRRQLQAMIDKLRRPPLERCGIAMWVFLATMLGLWIISVLRGV